MVERPSKERGGPPWTALAPADVPALAADVAEGRVAPPSGPAPLALRQEAARVLDVPPPELLALLDRVLAGPQAAAGLEVLAAAGALAVLLPEVDALRGFHLTCRVHHKDLWEHTLEVVERTDPDPDLRWVALVHDIGKVTTRVEDARGRVGFLRHERLGAWYLRGLGARLGMPAARVERIAFVVEHAARVNAYHAGWSDRAVRRLARDAGEHLGDLLAFSGADFTTRRARRVSRIRAQLRHLGERLEALAREDREAASQALPRGLGDAIGEALGLRPGPELGEHVRRVRAAVEEGLLPGGEEPAFYVAWLRGEPAA